MVFKKEPEQKQGGTARILAAIAIIAVGLFLLASVMPGATAQAGAQPAASVSNYTPAPTLNTNVTWSTFNSSWKPLEYSNGTANLNLPADMSAFYANPITLKLGDLVANGTLQNDKVAGKIWNTITQSVGTSTGGAAPHAGNTTIGNVKEPYASINATEQAANSYYTTEPPTILLSELPSDNILYDYITIGLSLAGTVTTGASACVKAANGSSSPSFKLVSLLPNHAVFLSFNLAYLNSLNGGKGFNTTGPGALSSIIFIPIINAPETTSTDSWTLTMFAYALTTYPISIGMNATGAPQYFSTTGKIASFNPTTPMMVYNSGYSVAISENMHNITEQQTSINDGSYTEQATYQGTFELPEAPDLQYSASNITVPLTMPGSQYEVANLNGASYLTTLQTQTNGTFSFGTVNPNTPNSLVLEVKYTSAQWDASSSPPSFFSLAGLEYYWWVSVVGFLSLIGLAALATHDFGGDEGNLRTPKGKLGR